LGKSWAEPGVGNSTAASASHANRDNFSIENSP
jgi:hypothetical protein